MITLQQAIDIAFSTARPLNSVITCPKKAFNFPIIPLFSLRGDYEIDQGKIWHGKTCALLSRSIAGVLGKTLIYCLPGSVKAVTEYCNEILPTIEHSIYMLEGLDSH